MGFFDVVSSFHYNLAFPWRSLCSTASRISTWRTSFPARGRPNTESHIEIGNPLLSSMGKHGRQFLNLLLDKPDVVETNDFRDPGEGNLLTCLQSDILKLRDRGRDGTKKVISVNDLSIQVHSMHSPTREIEALHDYLLSLFDEFRGLEPRDIIVMTPQIEAYAPFIPAVFSAADDPRKRIPFSISDRSPRSESFVIQAFLKMLCLCRGRLAATEVMDLLDSPPVQARFGLVPGEMGPIRRWLRELQLYFASKSLLPAPEWLKGLCPAAIRAGTKKNFRPPTHPFFNAADTLLQNLAGLQTAIDRCLLALKSDFFAYARRELPKRKRQRNVRSFDDLLLDLRAALTGPAGRALAEQCRLFYVALTRAKYRCYTCWGAIGDAGRSAPAYLFHQQDGAAPDARAVLAHFEGLLDRKILSDLDELARRSNGTIEILDLPEASLECYQPPGQTAALYSARKFSGDIAQDWGSASFSGWTAGKPHVVEMPDHDAAAAMPGRGNAPIVQAEAGAAILDFPRGMRAGSCLHAIFEELDFMVAATVTGTGATKKCWSIFSSPESVFRPRPWICRSCAAGWTGCSPGMEGTARTIRESLHSQPYAGHWLSLPAGRGRVKPLLW